MIYVVRQHLDSYSTTYALLGGWYLESFLYSPLPWNTEGGETSYMIINDRYGMLTTELEFWQ